MLDDNLVIAFIPARGGSKGLPGKNLMKIAGKSMIERAVASATDWISGSKVDVTVVSSDDEAVLAEAKAAGAQSAAYMMLRLPLEVSPLFRDWLLQHYHDATLALLIGVVMGAFYRIWPWQAEQKMYLPWQYARQVGDADIGMALVCLVAGIGIMLLLLNLEKWFTLPATADNTTTKD